MDVICSPPTNWKISAGAVIFTQEDLEGILDNVFRVGIANHLRACVLFLCCSYLGKTRTDLKVFLPESEQYKNAEKEVLGLRICKMPDKRVACVNIFVVLHLSFQQTRWYFSSMQY